VVVVVIFVVHTTTTARTITSLDMIVIITSMATEIVDSEDGDSTVDSSG
jgi:hypothetical protein